MSYSHFWQILTILSTYQNAVGAERVSSVISTYLRRLTGIPFISASLYGRATLGANSVTNDLFVAFLFSDPDFLTRYS
jgi:hypothetical protein